MSDKPGKNGRAFKLPLSRSWIQQQEDKFLEGFRQEEYEVVTSGSPRKQHTMEIQEHSKDSHAVIEREQALVESALLVSYHNEDWYMVQTINPTNVHLAVHSTMDVEDPTFQLYLETTDTKSPEFTLAKTKFMQETIEDIKRMY